MKSTKILNALVEMGKRYPSGFTRREVNEALSFLGYKSENTHGFYLSHLKRFGFVDHYGVGQWKLTASGLGCGLIDDDLCRRILNKPLKNKTIEARKSFDARKPAGVDIAGLILEIKRINPKADISSLAVMM